MRWQITAHTREPIPEDRLTEIAAACGVTLHEVLPQETGVCGRPYMTNWPTTDDRIYSVIT